jgi:hypothetical protein
MGDLTGGRYPDSYEEWLLDGSPMPPYRQTMSRRDITVSTVSVASTAATVFPVVCQAGDVLGAVSLLVKTATATPTHSWVALYSGMATTSTLIAQSADVTTGFTANALKLSLGTGAPYLVGGGPGTSQGSANTGGASGPTILGVMIYNSGATGAIFDGMAGSAVAGAVAITGQVPFVFSATVSATATAPATLSGFTATVNGVPYVALSRS